MRRIPYRHVYPLASIELFLSLVLSAATSLRGAGRALEILVLKLEVPCPVPSWSAGRLWLLRLGYYKLTRPKVRAGDWVWVVDHTVQVGQEKCLVILGVRLSEVQSGARALKHEALEPIELLPVKQSNGAVVYQQLEQAVQKTGVPREILSDHGTDLNAGIEIFCQHHPQTSSVYDITHKTAAVLKHELEPEADWQAFTRLANQTKRQVQQTEWAAFAPPNQKSKARYLNVEPLVRWGQAMLVWLDQPPSQPQTSFDPAPVREKLGWITDFRASLAEWGNLFELITRTESVVRHHGLSASTSLELQHRLQGVAQTCRTRRVQEELITFVAQEAAKAHPGEHLLGSSEIIESVLGKMKRLEHDQAQSGFTGLVLGLCALVATTTQDILQQALETVSTQQVADWCREKLGRSVQSKRRALLGSLGEAE